MTRKNKNIGVRVTDEMYTEIERVGYNYDMTPPEVLRSSFAGDLREEMIRKEQRGDKSDEQGWTPEERQELIRAQRDMATALTGLEDQLRRTGVNLNQAIRKLNSQDRFTKDPQLYRDVKGLTAFYQSLDGQISDMQEELRVRWQL